MYELNPGDPKIEKGLNKLMGVLKKPHDEVIQDQIDFGQITGEITAEEADSLRREHAQNLDSSTKG